MSYRLIYSDWFTQVIVFEPEGVPNERTSETDRQTLPLLPDHGNRRGESAQRGLPGTSLHGTPAITSQEVGRSH